MCKTLSEMDPANDGNDETNKVLIKFPLKNRYRM